MHVRTSTPWQHQRSDDPMGPVSHAAAFLFAEFARLGALEAQLFVDDKTYEDRKKLTPDPKVKEQFDGALTVGDQLAATALQRKPRETNARFAKVLALGLRSDYAALMRSAISPPSATPSKEDLTPPSCSKRSPISTTPTLRSAWRIASLASNRAGSLDLQMGGMQADKLQGIEQSQKTADHGVLLGPCAKLLLAVAAFRDKDPAKGCTLLRGLATSYPNNPLYGTELSRCH